MLKPSEVIKQKLEQNNGKAIIPLLRSGNMEIWLEDDGVAQDRYILPNDEPFICKWEIFDVIVAKAKELGGIMYKGDTASQNGALIGSEELPLDTIDSYIAIQFYNGKKWHTNTRRSTYYAAILAWAGICKNKRSKGQGGFIELTDEWR